MLKVDFHTHTRYSHDSLTSIEAFINAARRSGLDRVVVTDHNNIRGALLAAKAAKDQCSGSQSQAQSDGVGQKQRHYTAPSRLAHSSLPAGREASPGGTSRSAFIPTRDRSMPEPCC